MSLSYKINNRTSSEKPIVSGNNDLALNIKVYDANGVEYSESNKYYGREDSIAYVKLTDTTGTLPEKMLLIRVRAYENERGNSLYLKFDNATITDSNATEHTVTLTGKTNAKTFDMNISPDGEFENLSEVNGESITGASGTNINYTADGDLGKYELYDFSILVTLPANNDRIDKVYTVVAEAYDEGSTSITTQATINQSFDEFVRFVATEDGSLTANPIDEVVFNCNGNLVSVSNEGTVVPGLTNPGVGVDSNTSWVINSTSIE